MLLQKALESYSPPRGLGLTSRTLQVFCNESDFTGSEIEQRETRRRARRLRTAGGIVASIIVALSVALVVTVLSQNEAERQRPAAEERRRLAVSRVLVVESRERLQGSYDLALLLAGEAARSYPSFAPLPGAGSQR